MLGNDLESPATERLRPVIPKPTESLFVEEILALFDQAGFPAARSDGPDQRKAFSEPENRAASEDVEQQEFLPEERGAMTQLLRRTETLALFDEPGFPAASSEGPDERQEFLEPEGQAASEGADRQEFLPEEQGAMLHTLPRTTSGRIAVRLAAMGMLALGLAGLVSFVADAGRPVHPGPIPTEVASVEQASVPAMGSSANPTMESPGSAGSPEDRGPEQAASGSNMAHPEPVPAEVASVEQASVPAMDGSANPV
ncbi:MAG: hypothetical protein M3145_09315, partial [Pseudomonadota bacterium]|nr:hypothetical protein [Pseudomonadota bacterium]